MTRRISLRSRPLLPVLLLCGATSALPPASAQRESPSIARLRKVEARLLPQAVVPGAPHRSSLAAFYNEANQELLLRGERAQAAFRHSTDHPFRMVTLIAGDAGIGKTFIKNEAFRRGYPDSAVCSFDLSELYQTWLEEGTAEARPDLYAESPNGGQDLVLSRLPAVRADHPLLLCKYLDEQDASLFLIDSLDEIHPADCERVLDQVERFVFDGDRDYVHVVVLGRSIAFRNYWHKRAGFYTPELMNLYLIHPPRFETTGDLLVSTWNYHCYFHKLCIRTASGQRTPMPFETFAQWSTDGYSCESLDAVPEFSPNHKMDSKVSGLLEGWLQQHRVVGSMFYNLAGNAFVREISEQFAHSGRSYDEQQVMSEYLRLWLQRDTKSNDRPSETKPQHLALYLQLLEEIAAKYAASDRLSDDGTFDVRYDDAIEIEEQGQTFRFPVYRILDRSGLKHTDPRTAGSRRYRFEPIWLHRYLLTKYEQRRK